MEMGNRILDSMKRNFQRKDKQKEPVSPVERLLEHLDSENND
jgi:hypothetical protein